MFINDNRRNAHGMTIEDCKSGAVVELEDRDGFYIVLEPSSVEGYLDSTEFEEGIEAYSFILNCFNGEFDAIKNYTWCYPLNASMIIE